MIVNISAIDDCESTGKVENAIARGLIYLAGKQLPSGAFPVCVWSEPRGLETAKPDSNVFPAAIMVHSLSFSRAEVAKRMVSSAVEFLASQIEPGAIWRYWTK